MGEFAELDAAGGEGLREVVVEIAGEAAALFFLGLDELAGEGAEAALIVEELAAGAEGVGDVFLDADVVGESAPAVEDGGEAEVVPEGGAVLAEVAQLGAAGGVRLKCGAEGVLGGLAALALEDPAVSPEQLGGAVAGEALEGFVDVDEG